MSIQIYILSKLMAENSYPYKLKKQLSEPIPFDKIGNLTESKLYYHFDSLSKQGLIEPVEVVKEVNRPDKQVYAITDKGRAQLPSKIYQLLEKAEAMSDMIVGLVNIRFVDRGKVVAIIEKRLEQSRVKKAYIKDIYAQIHEESSTKEVVDFLDGYYTAFLDNDIEWLETLVEKLKTESI